MGNGVEMGKKSKEYEIIGSLTHKYGKPQGNELIWGRMILRMIGIHRFEKVAYFDSYLQANEVFYEWIRENNP
jgi:hypothetical protein